LIYQEQVMRLPWLADVLDDHPVLRLAEFNALELRRAFLISPSRLPPCITLLFSVVFPSFFV